jgi:hypothetical protein
LEQKARQKQIGEYHQRQFFSIVARVVQAAEVGIMLG